VGCKFYWSPCWVDGGRDPSVRTPANLLFLTPGAAASTGGLWTLSEDRRLHRWPLHSLLELGHVFFAVFLPFCSHQRENRRLNNKGTKYEWIIGSDTVTHWVSSRFFFRLVAPFHLVHRTFFLTLLFYPCFTWCVVRVKPGS
jgi:hypothetical protein